VETIFQTLSLDRSESRWEERIFDLTPVEGVGNLRFKREDKFAPLGYGGINGSKLRQCIWLVTEYLKEPGAVGMISGTSVKSPQLPMGSAIAAHYGLKSLHVIGATNTDAAIRHENVAMATWFGARFAINPNIAYNPVLQKKVRDLKETDPELSQYFYLEYGITLDHHSHPGGRIERFHFIGSEQVRNLPDDMETLVIPSGSCNSTVSILYGLARFRPKNLKRVYLIGIGPPKLQLIEERLEIISRVAGLPTRLFKRDYISHPDVQSEYEATVDEPLYELIHHDLHTTGYVDYQTEVPFSYKGIEFHPTYEGKMMTYVCEKLPALLNHKSVFWIVGSKPRAENMRALLAPRLGAFPTRINEYVQPK
jgi:1-aminocyclopropane-1-carboxylate deaminase/D-cysteine desulfhydrase-like pyridoxal-dependent ACC family enzyme